MNDPQQQQKLERLRAELLDFLAAAKRLKFNAEQLWRIVGRKLGGSPEETLNELAFLAGAGFVSETFAPLGATKEYQATAAGVLKSERGE